MSSDFKYRLLFSHFEVRDEPWNHLEWLVLLQYTDFTLDTMWRPDMIKKMVYRIQFNKTSINQILFLNDPELRIAPKICKLLNNIL